MKPSGNRRIAICTTVVLVAAFLILVTDISRLRIAATYADPIARIRAQDESVYVNCAIRMVTDSDWLTPKVMGRPFLFKPPLQFWSTALAIRIFGLSLFSVRLPAIWMGALGIAAIFAWVAMLRSITAGILAAAILLCSPFWQTFSRLCYTDVTASSFIVMALLCVVPDPQLTKSRTRLGFGVCGAAAILTKSVAGAIPFAALFLYCLVAPAPRRQRFVGFGYVLLAALAVSAPWHIYQALHHPQWFWADYVQVQLLGIGMRSEAVGFLDAPILHYLLRIVQMDPTVALLGLLGIAGAVRFPKLRETPGVRLAICWAVVTLAALCSFQAKNLPYVIFLLPAFCVVGGLCGPKLLDRRPAITVVVLIAMFGVKLAGAGAAWSLRPAAPPIESANAMTTYLQWNRDAELISVEPDDEFYVATLPLAGVRYSVVDPAGWVRRFAPHYVPLGITLWAEQFVDLPRLFPVYQQRLREWGFDSTEPIGTMITLRTQAELAEIVRTSPQRDFYVPASWIANLGNVEESHRVIRYSPARLFLLSRSARLRTQPAQPIPNRW